MAIIVWNDAGAQSYVSLAAAETYFVTRLNAGAWTGATTPNKEAALVTATGLLDLNGWAGTKTVANQPLGWPRTGVSGVEDTALPPEVVKATLELALALLTNPKLAEMVGTDGNIRSIQAGSVSIAYFAATYGAVFPKNVMALIFPFISSSSGDSVGIGGYVSGNCDDSAFPSYSGRVREGY